MAFLDERDTLLEIANDALNLMAYLDTFQRTEMENGVQSPRTMVAKGKLYAALKKVKDKKLRQRILQSREQLEKASREFLEKWKKAEGK